MEQDSIPKRKPGRPKGSGKGESPTYTTRLDPDVRKFLKSLPSARKWIEAHARAEMSSK